MTIDPMSRPQLGLVAPDAPRRAEAHPLPAIIQGGMGVAVSGWQLARAVAQTGELGVVSGTALDVVLARRLQQGDPGGHVRAALAAFPDPAMARRVMRAYFVNGGIAPDVPFAAVPRFRPDPPVALQELTVVAAFVEVQLARTGHDAPVGINLLRKIEMPLPWVLLGAMLAGVDYVLVGAGNPAELPATIRSLAAGDDVTMAIRTQGLRSDQPPITVTCSPGTLLANLVPAGRGWVRLGEPRFLAIVASTELAAGLAADPATRPFGFVVEGPSAGGHNAPPRGPRHTDERGQPVYDERDEPDLGALADLGLPFWLAGSWATPEGLRLARALGAQGIQVGTVFAYCAESGFDPALKQQVLDAVMDGTIEVRSDWRASPTGFPFRVVELEGTLTDPAVKAQRKAVCDLGHLRAPFLREDGEVDFRCPSEPAAMYARKGGRAQNAEGRVCLCNALLAAAGLGQRRKGGVVEPALVTSGEDFRAVRALAAAMPGGPAPYPAGAAIEHLRAALAASVAAPA
jgi:NAD(P)H-dependent flavin oxidoreductase YrpB (nitropropane dioxygenase family)